MIAIILAAGDSIFWKWETRKHLFPLGKEKIIERLQRQLNNRNIDCVVITDDIDIMAVSKKYFEPSSHNGTIDTLEASREVWKNHDRVVVLLGDTIYSKNTLNRIIAFDGEIGFFGKECPNKEDEVLAVSTKKISEIFHLPNNSSLRDYYELTHSELMCLIDDYTTDIDTNEQYKEFISNVVNAGKLDDTKSS